MWNPHDRPMHTNDVIKTAIKRHVPAPGAYEASKGDKPILGFSTVSDIGSYHVDEAVYHAKQTPQVCYKELSSLTFLNKPRHLDTKIIPPKLTVEEAAAKPKKSQDPDMGTYEAPKSKDYFKDQTGFSGKLSTAPFQKFYEQTIKRSKLTPAPSHYKLTKDHFNRLSRSPPSIRTMRH